MKIDAVLINFKDALYVGLNHMEDSKAIEDADSPYVNVVVVREGDKWKEKLKPFRLRNDFKKC